MGRGVRKKERNPNPEWTWVQGKGFLNRVPRIGKRASEAYRRQKKEKGGKGRVLVDVDREKKKPLLSRYWGAVIRVKKKELRGRGLRSYQYRANKKKRNWTRGGGPASLDAVRGDLLGRGRLSYMAKEKRTAAGRGEKKGFFFPDQLRRFLRPIQRQGVIKKKKKFGGWKKTSLHRKKEGPALKNLVRKGLPLPGTPADP